MIVPQPPGWYPDPDGVPVRSRWWDGREWTAMTLPAVPAVPAVPAAPVDPVTRTSSATVARNRPGRQTHRPGAPGGRPGQWFVGAAVLALVGLLVVAVLRSPVDRPSRGADDLPGTALPSAAPFPGHLGRQGRPGHPGGTGGPGRTVGPGIPSVLPLPAPTYTASRVIDPAAGLSYQRPAGVWQRWNPDDLLVFGLGTAGVFQITQHGVPGGGVDRAVVVSGPLLPVVVYTGPANLSMATRQLAESLELIYYPRHTRRVVAAQPIRVDGAPGFLVRFELTFDGSVHGYEAGGAALAVVVVDTGRPEPGVLYLSFPDTRRALWPGIDRVIGSLHVVR